MLFLKDEYTLSFSNFLLLSVFLLLIFGARECIRKSSFSCMRITFFTKKVKKILKQSLFDVDHILDF